MRAGSHQSKWHLSQSFLYEYHGLIWVWMSRRADPSQWHMHTHRYCNSVLFTGKIHTCGLLLYNSFHWFHGLQSNHPLQWFPSPLVVHHLSLQLQWSYLHLSHLPWQLGKTVSQQHFWIITQTRCVNSSGAVYLYYAYCKSWFSSLMTSRSGLSDLLQPMLSPISAVIIVMSVKVFPT